MASAVAKAQTFSCENQYKSVIELLNDQRKARRFCDVILRVGKEQFYAHSNVLAATSPYFGAFLGQGQDHPRAFSQKTPQVIEIHIDGDCDNHGFTTAVSLVLDYMYSSNITLDSNYLVQVVEIAKIMQMEKVLEFCNKFESGKQLDVDIPLVRTTPVQTQTEPQFTFLENKSVQTCQTNTIFDIGCKIKQVPNPDVEKVESLKVKDKQIQAAEKCKKLIKKSSAFLLDRKKDSKKNISLPGVTRRKRGRPPLPFNVKINNLIEQNQMKKEGEIDQVEENSTTIAPESNNKHIHEESHEGTNCKRIKFENAETLEAKKSSKETNMEQTGGRFPSRKNRGKKPSKFLDDAESDSDALVVDETVDESSPSQLKLENIWHNCDECPYSTNSSYQYNRHAKAHQNDRDRLEGSEKEYKCDRCDFSAHKYKVLQTHIQEHLHAENICSFCDFEAENSDSLLEHIPIHKPPHPYHCIYCDSKYKTRAQLNVHLPKHLTVKPFVCEICQAAFKWKHALKCHMATHSETKDHLCDVCGFATAHKSQLKAHKLIHTGDTYKCEYPNCKFQSIKKQSLKYHILTHTQEKPHQCEICGQSFSLKKNLNRHALLHTDVRPYKCKFNEVCNFATTRYDKLKEHLLKIHSHGEAPSKRFRLSDYPKSLVPPDEEEPPMPSVIHIENSDISLGQISLNDLETKVYIQQPGGESVPITLVASKFEIPYQLITKLEN
ncbi:zinc finger protein ZFP2-like [Mytilus californianus]|uniref:zinc finger protein ZFP2-like n=1 Tax=Mytilus californianus TaxID=6549 RepID=UPI002247BDD2|nr:zinc finger protein ZFP2-like [Mytilus californianus]